MAVDADIGVALLESEIKKTYSTVSAEPERDFIMVPDKDAVFSKLHRVLVPGGRLQIADVTIQRPVSEGRRNIGLWTG